MNKEKNQNISLETYTIILKHEYETVENNKIVKIPIDEPLCVTYSTPRFGSFGAPLFINEALYELKRELLKRMEEK